jgi:RNA polymerase II subunit A C-terminal domain phosphatase
MLRKNSQELTAQVEERPLAKKQEALSEGEPPIHHHHHHKHNQEDVKGEKTHTPPVTESKQLESPPTQAAADLVEPEKVVRKALLKNDDTELQRVKKVRTALLIYFSR